MLKTLDLWLLRRSLALRDVVGKRIVPQVVSGGTGERAGTNLELFDFEASPYCRRVRETLSALELDVLVRPCPRTTLLSEGFIDRKRHRYREMARANAPDGETVRFPMLIDRTETPHVTIHQSKAIVRHLFERYSQDRDLAKEVGCWVDQSTAFAKKVPVPQVERFGRTFASLVADGDLGGLVATSAVRPFAGVWARACLGPEPPEPLSLVGHEACARTRRLREVLCELQVPYYLQPCHPTSSTRLARVLKGHGLPKDTTVPVLVDPNGIKYSQSCDDDSSLTVALNYLEEKYGAPVR